MDRFVWFVLLVVISHLVTEFTRVTGYTRGPRQDVVMVNDSSIQPIRVQNLVLYPGQEYGHYEQQNQQYYNANNHYSNYGNSNNKNPSPNTSNSNNNNSFLSNLFNQFTTNNGNSQPNAGPQQPAELTNSLIAQIGQDVRTFSFRPIIDSIFEIPISTLRAVNNLVGRLTGGYQQPQQSPQQDQQQQQHHLMAQQQPPPNFSLYPSFSAAAAGTGQSSYYGRQNLDDDRIQPKTEFEMLQRIQQQTAEAPTASDATTATKKAVPVASTKKLSAQIKGFQR